MPSGLKRLQVNPSERAVSTDINRLQQFASADAAERFRALMNTDMGVDDFDAGALYAPFTTQQNPAAAEVFAGLLVQPQIGVGNLNLLVTAGTVQMLDPDAVPSTDDSPNKLLVADPGVPAPGALVMTANASGSTRIDVIECARTTLVIETDSRDIFDPVSGLFTAQLVNKVIVDRLQYRVRLGTPGAGFPGTAAGWCPLAVASVPNTATTNDSITFWDVRPLVSDRIFAPAHKALLFPRAGDINLDCDGVLHSPKVILTGTCDVTGQGSGNLYRLGGEIHRGTPGLDSVGDEGVDLTEAANQSTTFAAAGINYVYLLEPFGLPRWARYTDAVSGLRKPRSPRGILVVSSVAPNQTDGGWAAPAAPVPFPTSTGFVGQSTAQGCCIAAWNSGPGNDGNSFIVAKGVHFNRTFAGPTGDGYTVGTVVGGNTVNWVLTPGTSYPGSAKILTVTLRLVILVPIAGGAGTPGVANPTVDLFLLAGATTLGFRPLVHEQHTLQNASTGAAAAMFVPIARVRVPILDYDDSFGSPLTLSCVVTLNGASSVVEGDLYVLGWET